MAEANPTPAHLLQRDAAVRRKALEEALQACDRVFHQNKRPTSEGGAWREACDQCDKAIRALKDAVE